MIQTYRGQTRHFDKTSANAYKNEVGQPADGDYVGNWWIVGKTYSGDGEGWLESVPGV